MADDYITKYDGLWGESLNQLKNRLRFSRRDEIICIYCGNSADTREHCPPRSFLKKPYPSNLIQLPACYKCNNAFSKYEEQTQSFLKSIYLRESGKDVGNFDDIRSLYDDSLFPDYFVAVIEKVARGHAIYELSEGFGDIGGEININAWKLKSNCSEDEWNELNMVGFPTAVSELGSRSSLEYYVIEAVDNKNKVINRTIICDWKVIQEGVYRYMSYHSNENVIVKMIFMECLFVECQLCHI